MRPGWCAPGGARSRRTSSSGSSGASPTTRASGELVAAWARLRDRWPRARLVLVGPVDERDAFSTEALESLRADPRVTLIGHVADCRPFYLGFDLLVLPSYREGFPNVLLEGAAMALPIVTTTATGCVDAVEDGVTGTLVPVGAVAELTAALERYCGDERLRRSHGEAGRRRVVSLFDRRGVWAATWDTYRRLTARDRD